MVRSLIVPGNVEQISSFAERAETLGYDRLWVGELWGTDAFVALAEAALATDDIDLGTAIVNVYGRSPATLAQAAASVTALTDGTVILGLGTSTPKAVEDLHGVPFENPPRRLHETIELAREFLQGADRVSYEGELFEVADFPALGQGVPVYAAALGPSNRRATGRTADGWLPHNIPFEHLGEAFETVRETARQAGRDPGSIAVAPYVPAAVSDDAEAAYAQVAGHLAYYVGSGEGYRRAVAQQFPDEAEEVAEAWHDGDREAAREAVTREMVDALGVAGTPETAPDKLGAVEAIDVIDEAIVVVPTGTDDEMTRATVDVLAPE